MSEITESNRLEQIERQLASLTKPRPAELTWGDYQEIVGAKQELAREARRQAAERRDEELREQMRREAPARQRRAAGLAAIDRSISETQENLTRLREERRCLESRPLEMDPADPEPDTASSRVRLRGLVGRAA